MFRCHLYADVLNRFCLPALLWIIPWISSGQMDTLQSLKEVTVTALRIDFTDVGKHTDGIDSQDLARIRYDNLATLLMGQTPLFVRSYGNGTLATLGIRGGSANHTQLLWNGIPLRNPMLGMVDLSLIPSVFFDNASVHYGGHGAAFGSGAIGGLISFANERTPDPNTVHLHLSAGSWDRRLAEVRADYGSKALRFSTRVFSQYMLNNFRYRVLKELPERNQVHHKLDNAGLLQEATWQMSARERLTGRLWFQDTDRQIPPLSTQKSSAAAQQDHAVRASLHWARNGDRIDWQVKAAMLDESIDYQDSLIQLFTHHQFRTWLAEGEFSLTLAPGLRLASGLYGEQVQASSVNYQDAMRQRRQIAAFASLRYVQDAWIWRFQLREEVTQSSWSPLLLDLSTEWLIIKNLRWKASLSRNYRVPSLNDLHWRPGGNEDLVPESGWTVESGITLTVGQTRRKFQASLTAYTRTLDQWIMWMPPVRDLRNFWSPINVALVHSKGIEFRQEAMWMLGSFQLDLHGGIDMTWSTFGTALPVFTIEEGDQLFYVPVENVLGGLTVSRKGWSMYYRQHWFGSAPGINEEVKAATVGMAGGAVHFSHADVRGSLYLQAENIWNVPYRIIERRPMPGRSFVGGVRLRFE